MEPNPSVLFNFEIQNTFFNFDARLQFLGYSYVFLKFLTTLSLHALPLSLSFALLRSLSHSGSLSVRVSHSLIRTNLHREYRNRKM